MHIPDGFLNAPTYVAAYGISGTFLSMAAGKLNKNYDDRMIPYTGVMAAFIFAGQMVNFPIIGGTSGHLLGAALATITLGPWAAGLIMAAVLTIQCLFFQDGGLTALGANILLMGVVAPLVSHWVAQLITAGGKRKELLLFASFAAGWASVVAASLVCAVLLWLSGQLGLSLALKTMGYFHSVIGIGEGIITMVVVSYLARVKGDMLAGLRQEVAS